MSGTIGGSANVYYCLTGGAEYSYGLDKNNKSTHTLALEAGASVKCPVSAEIHGGATNSAVLFKVNIFDILGSIYDAITIN